MGAIKCNACQKAIHIGKNFGTSCIFCGSVNTLPNLNVSEDLQEYLNRITGFIKDGKFGDAIEACNNSIEAFPNISELYWLRMLAHYNCKNDVELIQQGINIKNDPDFTCCVHFADGLEKDCLKELCKVREAIISDINQALATTERKEKIATGIRDLKQKAESELAQLRDDLRKQIAELDTAEKEVRDAFFDCSVLISSQKQRFNTFLGKAEQNKKQIDSKREMTENEKVAFEIILDKFIAAATTEFNGLKAEKEPCFNRYKQAKVKQDKIVNEINKINNQISHIYGEQRDIINAVSEISRKYADAMAQIDSDSLSSAATLIGRSTLTEIIKKHIKFRQ